MTFREDDGLGAFRGMIIALGIMLLAVCGCVSLHKSTQWRKAGLTQAAFFQSEPKDVREAQINWLDKDWWDYLKANKMAGTGYAVFDLAIIAVVTAAWSEYADGQADDKCRCTERR